MIVILTKRINATETSKTFGGVVCDVCETPAPRGEPLLALGWFIAPGQHRCPEHYHDDVPARGPLHKEEV